MAALSNTEKTFLKQLVNSVRRSLTIAWLFTIISALLFVWQAWLLASLFSTWLTNYFNELPLSTDVSSFWFVGLIICFTLRPLLNMARELISTRASLKVRSDLRESLLTTMSHLGPNLRHFGSDGSISSQIIDQTDALDGFISRFSVQKNVTVSTPIILLIAVAWQSKFAAALLFMTAPLVPVFMILIGHLTARKSAAQFNALSQLSGRFLDWVRGMPTLKRLQAAHIAEHDLAQSSEEYRRRTMDVLKIAFLNGAVLELLAALSIALVAVYLGFGLMGILPWDKGHIPVDYFGALFILLLAPEFYVPLRQLGADYHAKAEAEGAVQSLLPIIEAGNKTNEVSNDPLSNQQPQSKYSNVDLSQAFGISLTNLSIRTPIAADTDTLDDMNSLNDTAQSYRTRLLPVSFDIAAGERIALVGDSGSGKSSLLQALMGFVDYQGDIELTVNKDSRANSQSNANFQSSAKSQSSANFQSTPSQSITRLPIGSLPVEQLRQHIGYLAQQVALMPLTIAENLRLANSNASDEQLIKVLDIVGLWGLIQRLPKGIDTQLGDRGQGLSGGQQQRLGIAQLLLRNDSLWLLDEPTEHLDPDTAQHIHDLLETVSRGKTVIWITHAHEQLDWLDKVVKLSLPSQHNTINHESDVGIGGML